MEKKQKNFKEWANGICYKISLVNWLCLIKLQNMFSNKIKIGFGPVHWNQILASRRFHIDPIVNYINKHGNKYVCDIFFNSKNLSDFDVIIIVKFFGDIDINKIGQLKRDHKILIYDIVDIPDKRKEDCLEEIRAVDGIILSNPLIREEIKGYNPNFRLIETPIVTRKYKKDYKEKGAVKIVWDGYAENLHFMDSLNPIVERLARESNYKINMIYHSNVPSEDKGIIKYIEWKARNWEKVLVDSDIAVVIKPLDDKKQQRKPPTKVNTYRALGLPVVCTPSEADKLVIEHGKTGYFAYTDEDWYKYLKKLIEDRDLRKKIGKAGREYVVQNFSKEKIVQKYLDFFDGLVPKEVLRKNEKDTNNRK